MSAGRKKQNFSESEGKEKNPLKLTKLENRELNEGYADLEPNQLMAIRLESSGITDRQTIATQLDVDVQTISNWRSKPMYQKIKNLNVQVLERAGRQFREECIKGILFPAFSELIRRMNDQEYIKLISAKDLTSIITVFMREMRQDKFAPADGKGDNELEDLQKRRNVVAPGNRGNDLEKDSKIVEFPKKQAEM